MKTKNNLSIGQRVTVNIWCCGKAAPATVAELGKFGVTVSCEKCKSRHSVSSAQVALTHNRK